MRINAVGNPQRPGVEICFPDKQADLLEQVGQAIFDAATNPSDLAALQANPKQYLTSRVRNYDDFATLLAPFDVKVHVDQHNTAAVQAAAQPVVTSGTLHVVVPVVNPAPADRYRYLLELGLFIIGACR